MVFNPTQLLIKPTYDVSSYGEDLTIQLGTDTLALKGFTVSSATFEQSSESATVFHMGDEGTVISDTDTIGIAYEGNDTAYDRTFQFLPDMSAFVYKYEILAGFALNCSAYTSGALDIDSVRFTLSTTLPDGSEENIIFDRYVTSSTSALSGTGTNLFIVHLEDNTPLKLIKGYPVRLQIRVNETISGTNTRQVGILPFFPFQKEALAKIFTTSVFDMHLHPTLDHAFPVFRDQSAQETLDYGGVTINNSTRGVSFLGTPSTQPEMVNLGGILG
jgi:hypothetical protein